MRKSLLGMTFFKRLKSFRVEGGRLILTAFEADWMTCATGQGDAIACAAYLVNSPNRSRGVA